MKELDRITVDPEICSGQPTVRGMRITVSVILKQVAGGMNNSEILKAYPELEEEDIVQALKYAAWLSSEKTRSIPFKRARRAETLSFLKWIFGGVVSTATTPTREIPPSRQANP